MFGISVSGINGAQKHLDVTSNNIANANSFGFKKSRAEFADIYANSIYSNNRIASGMGVNTVSVSQQFAQGALTGDTGNALDMAIQGNGFFVLSQNNQMGGSDMTFTRNGAFQVDKDGYIVTAMGDYLQGWDVNEDGTSTSLDLNSTHSIHIPSDTGAPAPSRNIGIGVNMPANKDPMPSGQVPDTDPLSGEAWTSTDPTLDTPEKIREYIAENGLVRGPDGAPMIPHPDDGTGSFKQYYSSFDPKNADTYTCSTSQTIHDSLGNAHTLTYYMIKQGGMPNDDTQTVWNVIAYVDGQPVDIASQGEGVQNNPVMISVTDPNSSVKGANFFGFQMIFGSDGELLKDDATGAISGLVPSGIELVNPKAGMKPEDPIANSLRQQLFGVPNAEPGEGGEGAPVFDDIKDLTFETPDDGGRPIYAEGNGALHKVLGVGVDPSQVVTIDFTKSTQYGSSNFTVSTAPWNDGFATGLLLGVSVDENGIIQCEYSNGRLINIAKLALADFTNTQGLTKIGDSQWRESLASGPAIAKEAHTGSAGSIIGSNLEMSNVDLTSELVNLITAQRNYQANSQALQTQNTVMDSILNIR